LTAKRPGKKIVKITGISFGILLVLLAAFHFWFIAHAKDILENLVKSKSHGKLRLKVEKFKFGYFSTKIELEKAVFYNTDTVTAVTAYRFSVGRIKLNVNSILPVIFKKQIEIDSLLLINPDIQVTRLKALGQDDQLLRKDISIPEEMGKIYNSIQEALKILKVKRFEIDNAKFTLINKIHPDQQPITITRLFFHINNVQIDSSELSAKDKILFGDNAVLRTRNQDILLPDGRHRLSFKRFRINLRKKLVQFDSCTIATIKTDSSNASFKIFFDALLLTHIDFDTLYHHDVIKADSVYCVNPQFNLDIKLGKKTGKGGPPKLDRIIQQLAGNMQLGFVIVNNASVNINTERNGKPSSFTSDHNNFEVQGLSVDEDAQQPLKIKSFAMAIRNYENFLKDSSYSIQFDSILFNNNRIFLSNFKLRQLNQGKISNSFSMPQFQLRGLSWDDLVFNRLLKAKEVTLYHPLIDYTVSESQHKKNKKRNIFSTLANIDKVIELEELNVVEGKINLKLKNNTELHLENASLSIQSRSLLDSRKISVLENSINELQFRNGIIKTKDLTIELTNMHYTGNNAGLLAEQVKLNNRQNTMSAVAGHVSFNEIMIDDKTGNIRANGVYWKEANVKIILPQGNKKSFSSAILLKNIKGENTNLQATIGKRSVSAFLKTVSLDELIKNSKATIQFKNPYTEGKKLKVSDENSLLTIADYNIADKKNSSFRDINYTSYKNQDSVNINIPLVSLSPDIHNIMDGLIKMGDVKILNPVANVKLFQHDLSGKTQTKLPRLDINKITLQQPKINFSQLTNTRTVTLEWDGKAEKNNLVELTDLVTNSNSPVKASAHNLRFTLNHFLFNDNKGKIFNAGNGEITAQLKNTNVQQTDDHRWKWSSVVENILAKNFLLDSLGKSAGRLNLDYINLEDISVNSSSINNWSKIANENPSLQLKKMTGQYDDLKNHFDWFNAGYNQESRVFSVDSFHFHSTLDQDAFIASHSFQTDYLKVKTGKITLKGVDPDFYFRDSILKIQTLNIDDAELSDFRDNRPPFHSGIIKPLPAKLIKKIPFKLSIDTILLSNANTIYSELNGKTEATGTIPVTRMTIRIFPVRNYNLTTADSIRIQANGYLMDSIWVRLRIRESYTDSLSGFLMTVRMKPHDLQVLNPVFMPLSSVKLQSGYLDTLTMRAIGKDNFSYGEMKMYYHDLKIKFLNKGSEIKKGFLSGLKTFVANSFVIKNKNSGRTGRVFFLRNRERSMLNYIVKITMSGIASSVGAKSNQKILHRYKKELKQRNLPPFDYD
jgi:hypothetical protein